MKAQQATEQLLLSDAVDQSIAQLDFRILGGQKVYLDTNYVKPIKGSGFVNAEYIISSLRQQMFAARCLLQEKEEDADYIVEARVGALGADGHDVTYGLPASNLLSSAAVLIPNTPAVPTIPEIAVAKRNDNSAAAKVAVFAYHRESRRPVWQSGLAVSRSRAKDFWVLGAGPFQSGAIYDGTQFAGEELMLPLLSPTDTPEVSSPVVDYHRPAAFGPRGRPMAGDPASIAQANYDAELAAQAAADKAAAEQTSDQEAAGKNASGKQADSSEPAKANVISDQQVPEPPPAEPGLIDQGK